MTRKKHTSVLADPLPEQSGWTCYLFEKVPSWWVRFWSKVFFDCRWEKKQ